MADRSVSVFLRANVTGYIASIEKAKLSTRDFARDASKSAATHKESWDKVGKTMFITGGVIAAGLGLAVKAAMDFQAQMAQIKALSGATAADMKKLETAAKTVGKAFGISAKEAADAETELVKAGISVTDILGGALRGALVLAADGQMNVAEATAIAASAMVQFGLKGKDVPHIADLLAAGADKALGSVGDLGEAMKSTGTVAAQWGLSIEETVGTLAEFAAAGQTGERGGTLMRQALLQLSNAQGPAKALMDQYGFSVETAGGGLIHMSELAGRLQKSFGGLTPAVRTHALAVIFGAHAIQGANILMKDGAAGSAEWTKKVTDAGFGAEQASKKLDSLAGDLQKLKASFQTALIDTGEEATGSLRHLAKGATTLVNAFDDLSGSNKAIVVELGLVVAGAGLVGGAALIVIPKIVAFKAALVQLGWTAKGTAASLEGLTAAEIAAGGGAAAGGGLLSKLGPAAVGAGLGVSTLKTLPLYTVGGSPDKLESPYQRAGRNFEAEHPGAVTKNHQGFSDFVKSTRTDPKAAAQLKEYMSASYKVKAAQDAVTASSGPAADGVKKVAAAAATAAAASTAFDAALKALSGRFDVRTQTDAMTKGFRELGKQAKTTGTAVHGNSDAAIANRTALTGQYQAALGIIQTYKEQGHSAAEVKQKTKEVTDQFATQAGKAGFVKTKIQNYIDALHKVPTSVASTVTLNTTAAQRKLAALKAGFSALDFYARQKDGPPGATGGLFTGMSFVRRSQGGPVWGAGTATSDSVPAMLSAGEYVIKAASVAKIGVANLDAINHLASGGLAQKFAANGLRAYATGGLVGDANLSAIQALLSGTVTSGDDVASARARQARATAALLAAESALRKLRHDDASASKIHAEEQRVLADRLALASATSKLSAVRAAYAAGRAPLADRYAKAAASVVRTDGAFIANLSRLAARGFGAFAQELYAEGDNDARTIAAQAVKWSTAKLAGVQNNLVTSSQQAQKLASMFGGGGGPSVVQGQGPMVIYVQNPYGAEYLIAKQSAVANQQLTAAARAVAQRPR